MQDCSLLAADESQCLQGIAVVTTVKLIIIKNHKPICKSTTVRVVHKHRTLNEIIFALP